MATAVLRLSNVNFSKTQSRLNRVTTEITELSQLQSVRYFTGERSAQYWLTSFLGWLVKNNTEDKNIELAKLEDIDNKMSLALFHAELSQKQASFNYLTKTGGSFGSSNEMSDYLKQINGTGFEHYWFQKLEYELWKNEQNRADEKFKKHRISSKDAVEHVHPQHEEYDMRLEDNYLNAFGNLVLLSPGENSSYSNQTVGKKQEDFKAKPVYDSLKLKQIFELKQNDEWDKDKIKQHQKEMIDLLTKHYY
ncbi:HNH endonuclease family protein [Psychrosphaera algicola]|uniref:HNH endonuclease family protein n=1 Tax=Psychrosphaera algicola TaxID=3023714 RepID=A0ABT5FEV3_9GAMM|nr:HNH endonuclease family protein [Psychrosphaera sp. G1-22]MDC2889487.1 HNH endonuclease family protein [Psychrosphaera sp. G1-22]